VTRSVPGATIADRGADAQSTAGREAQGAGGSRSSAEASISFRDPDPENLLRLGNALVGLGARRLLDDEAPFGPADRDALAQHRNLSVVTRFGPLDVVQRVPALPESGELASRAAQIEAFGIPLLVISRSDLIAAKRARGAPRDLADIAALDDDG
jgi:hypothetical protein